MGYFHSGLGGRVSDKVFEYNKAVLESGLPYHKGSDDWLCIDWPDGVSVIDRRTLEWYLEEHLNRKPSLNEIYRACELYLISDTKKHGVIISENF